jgi:hypothetical protein
MVSNALTFIMISASSKISHISRHSFRASLPFNRDARAQAVPLSDRQLFVMTFIAGFMAFYGFLA